MKTFKYLLLVSFFLFLIGCGKNENESVPTVNGNDIVSMEVMSENEQKRDFINTNNDNEAFNDKVTFSELLQEIPNSIPLDESKIMYVIKDGAKVVRSDAHYGADTEGIVILDNLNINQEVEVIGTLGGEAIIYSPVYEVGFISLDFLSDEMVLIQNEIQKEKVEIVNSVKENSDDEFKPFVEYSFKGELDGDVICTLIDSEFPISQLKFSVNKNDIYLRIQACDKSEPIDISGLVYDWDIVEDTFVNDCYAKIYLKNDIGYISWIDDKIAYNLSMMSGANKEFLNDYANRFSSSLDLNIDKELEKLEENKDFKNQVYLLEGQDSTDIVYVPHLELDLENETFTFMFDYLSSYLPFGYYELIDDSIYCLTEDRLYEYTFDIIDDNTLEFNAEYSSPFYLINYSEEPGINQHLGEGIKDGSRFILLKE